MSTGQEKVVHRNLLLPVNFLPLDKGECVVSEPASLSGADSHDRFNGLESMASIGDDNLKPELSIRDGW